MEQKNLDIYGHDPLPWSRALDGLKQAATEQTSYWLATVGPDGRPHVAAVGALWVDDRFYFTSGAGMRKARNVAKNPNCVVSVGLKGLDLSVEGTAVRVTDEPTLHRIAKLYAALGWPVSVSGDAFTAPYSAPSAGRAPWNLYVLTPTSAVGVATAEPHGATRWRFDV